MGVFKRKSEDEKINAEITSIRTRIDELEKLIAETDAAMHAARAEHIATLTDLNCEVSKANGGWSKGHDLEDRKTWFAAALVEMTTKLADAEARLAAFKDRQERERQAADISQVVGTWTNRITELQTATIHMDQALRMLISGFPFEMPWVRHQLEVTHQYLLPTLRQMTDQLRSQAAGLLDGTCAPAPRPVAEEAAPAKPAPEMRHVFLWDRVCWHGADGAWWTAGPTVQTDLPPAIAMRAVELGLGSFELNERWKLQFEIRPGTPATKCATIFLRRTGRAYDPTDDGYVNLDPPSASEDLDAPAAESGTAPAEVVQ